MVPLFGVVAVEYPSGPRSSETWTILPHDANNSRTSASDMVAGKPFALTAWLLLSDGAAAATGMGAGVTTEAPADPNVGGATGTVQLDCPVVGFA